MLDTDTKRRIDSCRDILVGKVPDPKSQVEQITIALIYKFMDDMDAEAEELGGARSFFAGDYAKYGWVRLMAPNMGGFDVLALYSEAIQKMNENPGIPPLFRDIFKNAYLPYRDPETLRSFLKEIDAFTYDHSERLGDAFEYLLSVLGSQGDAGQFRTPRHIIDFMVEIIAPQKNESILDPACGTAGFLISAWKHILKHNTSPRPQAGEGPGERENTGVRTGDQLTPDERQYLAANIHGYDISPDMVRLSLVNLYLHGFTDPHIVEYDTLTSEEKWNETADVILANPPFMSPKGGIKPHKRFSVQATRSEVLFVDYMAEHLSPQGRAAIIVPEGIIFQSGTAYKKLREMLVKNSLVAVVSLPAGVFNPYSGVKTSILVLDKRLAKTSDSVLFVKVDNDGYNLGAQRRAVTGSGLPDAVAAYLAFRHSRESGNPDAFDPAQFANAHVVEKTRIGENGEWGLSGERYREVHIRTSNYPLVAIQEVAEVASGFGFPLDQQGKTDQVIPFLKVSDMNLPGNEIHITCWNNAVSREILQQLGAKSFPQGTIIFPKIGAAIATNKKRILTCESTYDNNVMGIVPGERIASKFLYALLQSIDLSEWASDSQPPSMRKSVVEAHKIPLPPLAIQQEIVAEIEDYQKIIDGARQVVENYQPRIVVQPDWPEVELGELIKLSSGEFLSASMKEDGPYPVYGGNGINGTHNEYLFESPTIVIGRVGAYCGAVHLTEPKSWITDNGLYVKEFLKPIDLKFLEQSLRRISLNQYAKVGGQPSISQSIVLERTIALPDLETQHAIVAEIEAEQALVNANKQLMVRFEAKIKMAIGRVWGG